MASYGNDSIRRKKGEDRVRDRPEALLGSNNLDGAKQTVYEIVGNTTDEKLSGFGDGIDIGLHEDDSISVRDYGRGVPLGWNSVEEEWNYFLVYEDLYAGGKYDDHQDILEEIEANNAWDTFDIRDYPYLVTIGLNGLGAAAAQYTSKYFEVTSISKGVSSHMDYKKGKHILDELQVKETTEPDGTYIHWKPDDEVFLDTKIPARWLEKICKNLSYVSEFDVTFNNKGTVTEYKRSNICEEMKASVGDNLIHIKNFTHTRDTRDKICVCDADVVIGAEGRGIEFFHNRIEVHGGVHSSAFNMALRDFFVEATRDQGVKIRDVDYNGKFSIIASTLSNVMSLHGQTKDHLNDTFIYNCLYECIYNNLYMEYQKGTEWIMNIINEVVSNARSRIAIAEMSKNLKEIEKSTKKLKVSEKFAPSSSYLDGDVEATEIFIVEGNSAGGRAKTARASKFQCILPIRGKSLNVYKASLDRLIANSEIKDMIAAFGCGVDLGIDGYESFDITKLKAGKIMLLADADIDGKHIITLLFLIIFRLFPELLYQGKVYIVYTPLYAVNLKDDTTIYCMSEDELNTVREEKGGFIRNISRFKGLGETSEDTLWETTLNPENRICKQIRVERNDTELLDAIDVLFGNSTDRRKRAILGSMINGYDDLLDEMDSIVNVIEGLNLKSSLTVEEVEV